MGEEFQAVIELLDNLSNVTACDCDCKSELLQVFENKIDRMDRAKLSDQFQKILQM